MSTLDTGVFRVHAVAYSASRSVLQNLGLVTMIPACPLAALPRGEAYRLDVEPPNALFPTEDGEIYAIDHTCTHQDASLADGWLEGCEVECPLHASRFDPRTGRVDAPPA